jgi:predicted PurR-regulated permease PerM
VDFNRVVAELGQFLGRPLQIGEYTLDLSDLYGQLSTVLSNFATSVAEGTLDVVLGVATGAIQVMFILIAAFYMVKDAGRLVRGLDGLAPPAYRQDFVQLRGRIADVWNAFLRGQLLLSAVVAIIVTVACAAIGLPYPVVLGLIAGILEVVPGIGPVLSAVPAVLLALFLGSSHVPLRPFWMAVLVAGIYVVIQQVENNVLVPRIMGRSLDLHPLIVLTAVVIGGNVAGILGILLAPPLVASLRVIALYVVYRLYDRDPFQQLRGPKESPEADAGLSEWQSQVLGWLRRFSEARGSAQCLSGEAARGHDEREKENRGGGGTVGRPDVRDPGRDE